MLPAKLLTLVRDDLRGQKRNDNPATTIWIS